MNEEDDLYESLPPSSTITTHMFAGALAGVGEHCVMYPFDCVKVSFPNADIRKMSVCHNTCCV